MTIRFPRALEPGDLVAVIAPSSGVAPQMHERLDAALAFLKRAGYRVREGQYLRQQIKGASASAAERAAEWMDAMLDPDVAAVIPPWGGERAIELLPLLDFARLADAPPKWFSGFSDLSTLQLPLLLRSGWASLHGPNLMQLAGPALDATSAVVQQAWRCGPGAHLAQSASAQSPWRCLNAPTASLHIEGRLVGGCLDSISRLAGSPYGALPAFQAEHAGDGAIVFLENAELAPFELARALQGLRLAGWFDQASAVLLGRNAASDGADFTADDAVALALGGLACPVVLDVDIGHVAPQWSVVQGAKGRVTWRDGVGLLDQRLS